MSDREHFEKTITFSDGGKKYLFYSALPDELQPPDKNFKRVQVAFGLVRFTRLED